MYFCLPFLLPGVCAVSFFLYKHVWDQFSLWFLSTIHTQINTGRCAEIACCHIKPLTWDVIKLYSDTSLLWFIHDVSMHICSICPLWLLTYCMLFDFLIFLDTREMYVWICYCSLQTVCVYVLCLGKSTMQTPCSVKTWSSTENVNIHIKINNCHVKSELLNMLSFFLFHRQGSAISPCLHTMWRNISLPLMAVYIYIQYYKALLFISVKWKFTVVGEAIFVNGNKARLNLRYCVCHLAIRISLCVDEIPALSCLKEHTK